MGLAVLLGLVAAVAAAFFRDYLDTSVGRPSDVRHLGLPLLGVIPETAGKRAQLVAEGGHGKEPFFEGYRVLRTALNPPRPEGHGQVVLVTSTLAGEGKSVTAVNLALSFAGTEERVLLIDADLRRPTLHQHFAIHKTPGLSDLIVGKAQASEAVQVTRFKGLHILPCGYIPPNPAELLGSNNMRSALAAFRKHYDWVLVDTAPILAMADTPVVCPFTDGLVLVVAAESTTRPSIQRSIDQVQSVGGKLVGVVLNKVNIKRNSYYYSQYYGEYYRSYYSSDQGPRRDGPPPRRDGVPPRREGGPKIVKRA
jgi:capsular exopolysaccharide synthesis family protein